MNFKWLPLLLISLNVQAKQFPVEVIEYIDDLKVVAFIEESDLEKSVHWAPMTEAVPLTVDKVIGIVKQKVSMDERLNSAEITGIELKSVPHYKNSWHYLVKLETAAGGRSNDRVFIVLMNGKLIPAIKEPETIK